MTTDTDLSYGRLIRKAWPIILANASAPLLGIADTAVIGNTGTVTDLGAIALGALIFSFVYWGFGFLRMGTTGFVAQADGAGDEPEVRATYARAFVLGTALGLAVLALQWPIRFIAFSLLSGSEPVEQLAEEYFRIRIWGAPATLATFAAMGVFIGLGRSRDVLVVQSFLNGLNILLDVALAGVLGWGARGVALGTAIAEWAAFALATALIWRVLRSRHRDSEPFWPRERIRRAAALVRTVGANVDILVRTLALVFGFAWFVDQSAEFGDVTLAANHVLLQFLAFGAFFLDGFAFVAESITGSALGARDPSRFRMAVRRTTTLAGVTAAWLSAGFLLAGPTVVRAITDDGSVQGQTLAFLPLAALYIGLSFFAFQLDGIFIGTTRTREMRNASLLSLAVFVVASSFWVDALANRGLWYAFTVYVVARAVCLGAYYPRLARSVAQREQAP